MATTKGRITALETNKADLVGGLVPLTQLGTGTPDSNKVLKGDSSWATAAGGTNVETHLPLIQLAEALTI